MPDSKRYLDWVQKAEADLRGAKILFDNAADYGLVAFHCQQSVEKMLKSFLLRERGRLYESHSLVFLCRKAREINAGFQEFMKDCAYINQFYIETRYPSDVPHGLTKDDSGECIVLAGKINDFVKGML